MLAWNGKCRSVSPRGKLPNKYAITVSCLRPRQICNCVWFSARCGEKKNKTFVSSVSFSISYSYISVCGNRPILFRSIQCSINVYGKLERAEAGRHIHGKQQISSFLLLFLSLLSLFSFAEERCTSFLLSGPSFNLELFLLLLVQKTPPRAFSFFCFLYPSSSPFFSWCFRRRSLLSAAAPAALPCWHFCWLCLNITPSYPKRREKKRRWWKDI